MPCVPTPQRHTFRECIRDIHSDLRRYRATGAGNSIKVIVSNQGFWASASLRWLTYIHFRFRRLPIIGLFIAAFVAIHFKFVQVLTGISLPVGTRIGPGLYIGHFDGIIVSSDAYIGSNCNLSTQVVIGFGRKDKQFGVPCIGNRVFIGPGAKILGPINIGNDVAIGANAVVVDNLPDRAVAVGIPSQTIGLHGSFDYIMYDGMTEDKERIESLKSLQSANNKF